MTRRTTRPLLKMCFYVSENGDASCHRECFGLVNLTRNGFVVEQSEYPYGEDTLREKREHGEGDKGEGGMSRGQEMNKKRREDDESRTVKRVRWLVARNEI